METAIGNVKHDYVEPVDEYMTVYLCFNRFIYIQMATLVWIPINGRNECLVCDYH